MLCLANVYDPYNDNPMFFSKLFIDFNNVSSNDLVLEAYFNLILNDNLNKVSGATKRCNYKVREIVHSHMRTMNFSDSSFFHPYKQILSEIKFADFPLQG